MRDEMQAEIYRLRDTVVKLTLALERIVNWKTDPEHWQDIASNALTD